MSKVFFDDRTITCRGKDPVSGSRVMLEVGILLGTAMAAVFLGSTKQCRFIVRGALLGMARDRWEEYAGTYPLDGPSALCDDTGLSLRFGDVKGHQVVAIQSTSASNHNPKVAIITRAQWLRATAAACELQDIADDEEMGFYS